MPVRMAIIKKNTTSVDKDVKKLEPLCTAGGKVKWHSHCGKQYGESSKIRNKITIWSSNLTSGYIPQRTENRILKRDMHAHASLSIIHSSQELEAI